MYNLSTQESRLLITRCQEDPVFFASEILGVKLWDKQKQIICSVKDNANTVVASGHGVGKTFTAAVTVLWFLFTHRDSEVITTAPTNRQVEHILWAEIANLYKNSKFFLGGRILKKSLHVSEKWFAVGFSTDEADKIQGHHAEDILFVADEAPGVEPTLLEAVQGILTTRGAKQLWIGNPTQSSGPFFDRFKNKLWTNFHISCYDSPAIKNPDEYPTLTTMKWIEERKEEWGEASPMFISRVKGDFPEEGEDTLIPLNWCLKAARRWEKGRLECQVGDRIFLGLDVARYGTNKTVLTTYSPHRMVTVQKRTQKKDTMDAVNMVVQEAMSAGAKFVQVTTDDTGLGGGVTDRLRELGYPVLAINFQQKPSDTMHFRSIRDEMYWHLRELFRSDEIAIPYDEVLIAQLSSIKYLMTPRDNKITIETKDEMRKRGLVSPDEADSLCITAWGARRLNASTSFRRKSSIKNQYRDEVYY